MEDEIDIEEHDLLDNPRIKSIFPNLSRVKIEISDDEDVQLVQDTPDYQHPHLLYQNFTVASGSELAFDEDIVNNLKTEDDTHFVSHLQYIGNNPSTSDTDQWVVQNNAFSTISLGDPNYATVTDTDAIACENDNNFVYVNDFDSDTDIDNKMNTSFDESDVLVANKIILGSKPGSSNEVRSTSHEIILGSKPTSFKCEEVFNSIILGTKPDYETLYKEALGSKTIVALEDWGVRLKTNLCFCQHCKILFPTVNALDAHKMVSHSFLVALHVQTNTARKSTSAKVTGKFCNHCNLTFPDDTSLIKHLYELLPVNQFNPDSVKRNVCKRVTVKNKLTDLTSPKVAVKNKLTEFPSPKIGLLYKCIICKSTFESIRDRMEHRRLAHPHMTHTQLFMKIKGMQYSKENLVSGRIQRKGFISLDRNTALDNLVSKATLFKCPRCRINFMTASTALQHTRYCAKRTPFFFCRCKRKIYSNDKETHEMQHGINASKIKQYVVYDRIYEKILYKCPKCSICFSEFTFPTHYRNCKLKTPQLDYLLNKCSICDLNIESTKFQIHQQRHNRFSKEDFIVLEFLERTYDTDDATDDPDNVVHKSDKIRLYYCRHCYCCQSIATARGHGDNYCVLMNKSNKKQCHICGLLFTVKSYLKHSAMHDESSVTLSDYTICDVYTGAPIDPPIHDLLKCESCDIIFIKKSTMACHICNNEQYEICYLCDKKYNLEAYAVHKHFHSNINEENIMPALIMKYNSINETWNIMYKCSECRLASMTYDSAVEHSQRHINNTANEASVRCVTCALNIEKSYYSSHNELHASNPSTSKTFNILTYNYKKLFKEDWTTLFKTLSQQDVDIILSKSIYKDVRRVKLNRVTKSDTDSIKFYCNRCKTQVLDVNKHIDENCQSSDRYKCGYCNKFIKTLHLLVVHETEHGDYDDKFAVVTFNDAKDLRFNNKLQKYSTNTDSSNQLNYNKGKRKKYMFFKCNKCFVCLLQHKATITHNCAIGAKVFCSTCNEYFSSRGFANHKLAHEMHRNLCKKNITIVHFEGEVKIVDRKVKFYKCNGCNISIGSYGYLVRHRCVSETQRKYCGKCDLFFSYQGYRAHKRTHSKYRNLNSKTISVEKFNAKNNETDIKNNVNTKTTVTENVSQKVTKAKHKYYKCTVCQLSCSTGKVEKHFCSPVKKYCRKCDLYFEESYFKNHISAHKVYADLKKENIHVIAFDKNKMGQVFHLYRCTKCSVCFREKKWIKTHLCKEKECLRYCQVCNLYFPHKSYYLHTELHVKHPDLSKNAITITNMDKNGKIVKITKAKQNCVVDKEENAKTNEIKPEESQDTSWIGSRDETVQRGTFLFYTCRDCNVSVASKPKLHHQCIKKSNLRYCSECNLYLAYQRFGRHRYSHKMYPSLCRKNISIKYFQNSQVEDNSNKSETNDKMSAEHNSDDEDLWEHKGPQKEIFDIYKCRQCNACVSKKESAISHHCKTSIGHKQFCNKCQIHVYGNMHMSMHKKFSKMNKNTLNIIEFDSQFSSDRASLKKYTLFKCINCKFCVTKKWTVFGNKHKCKPISSAKHCPECDQYFSTKSYMRHKIMHLKFPDLCAKKLSIIVVGKPKPKTVNRVKTVKCKKQLVGKAVDIKFTKPQKNSVIVYRCSCDLHFTSQVSIQKHMDVCGNSDVFKERCSKCSLLFPTDILVTHLVNHHSTTPTKILVKTVHKTILYKCPNCEICYSDKEKLYKHKDTYCNREDCRKCLTCGIFSDRKYIQTEHRCRDDDCNVYINEIIEVEKPLDGIILLKCAKCDLHITTIAAYDAHVKNNHETKRVLRTCNICELTFSSFSYLEHLKEHKKKACYTIKIIVPETGKFTIKTGENPQDIADEINTNITTEIGSRQKRKLNSIDVDDSIESETNVSTSVALRIRRKTVDYSKDVNDSQKANVSGDSIANKIVFEEDLSDKTESKSILDVSKYNTSLYKCHKCSLHYLTQGSLRSHYKRTGNHETIASETCQICGLEFSRSSFKRHRYVHHEMMNLNNVGDFVIKLLDAAKYEEVETKDRNDVIRLYKCNECNVCFTTQKKCVNHLNNHEVVDPKLYIECKICEFQFMITSLKEHMDMHLDRDFRVDDLMIEDYTIVDGKATKFDVYSALDRVQSKMVSTTTDVGDVSSVDGDESKVV